MRYPDRRRVVPRARRIVKWVGLVGCVLLIAAWVLSMFVAVICPMGGVHVALGGGAFVFDSTTRGGEFRWFLLPASARVFWLPERLGRVEYIPLWIPFVLIAIPTVIAWRRDRRPKPGHCACGYNLEGNVSGRCPECGEAV